MTSLRTAVAWTFAGNTIYAACQWAMLVIVAKLGSADAVGALCPGVRRNGSGDVADRSATEGGAGYRYLGRFAFGHYLAVRLLTSGAALLGLSDVCLVHAEQSCSRCDAVNRGRESDRVGERRHIRLTAPPGYAEHRGLHDSQGDVVAGEFGRRLYFTANLRLACLALACAWTAVLGLYDLRVAGKLISLRPIWNARALRSLVALAAPLGLVMGIMSLQANVSRYVIGASLGVGSVGTFAAIASLGMIGITVCAALGQVATPAGE